GRPQTRKRRPVVPMSQILKLWLCEAPTGHIVQYRNKPVKKLNAAWRNMRRRAGLDDEVNPYSIRHTMATELRARGVPELEIAGMMGHQMPNVRSTGRYAKYRPDYLSAAVEAIDDVLNEIGRVAARPIKPETQVRVRYVSVPKSQVRENLDFIGAGDEIRTHDPNLGKVVLYP